MVLALSEQATPEFEASLAAAAAEVVASKRCADALAASARAAARALASRVDVPQEGLAKLSSMLGSRGTTGGAKRDVPPVDTFLGEVLADAGAAGGAEGPLEALLSTSLHVQDLAPLTTLLKPLGPLRLALGNSVYASLVTRLEKYNDTEVAAVTAEKARYDKLKGALDTARAEYLAIRKGADSEQRLRAARSLDDARAAARLQRCLLAKAAAAAEATQGALLLDAAADVADAYGAFLRAAAASAPQFEAAAAALRSSAGEARTSGEALLTAAAAAAAAHTSAAEPGGSAVAAEMAEAGEGGSQASRGGATGQNLGRSHDADIRRLLASGPGHIIKRGYLNKQARSLMGGWRRRWFVLDSSGTLTYMNEQQLVTAAVKSTTKHGAAPLSGGAPVVGETGPVPAAPQEAAVGGQSAGGSGFGGKAMAFLQKRMDDRSAAGATAGGGAAASAGAPPAGSGAGGDDDDDEAPLANRTVNLQVSTVKLDGDPNDRSRDLRFCFRLISPNGSMVLQADSAAERDAWMATLQGVIAELLTSGASRPPPPQPPPGTPPSGVGAHNSSAMFSPPGTLGARNASGQGNSASLAAAAASGLSGSAIAARLSKGPGNGACADCGAPDPDWASLNCGVLICQHCAGAHRGLGTHVSKVRSIALDAASWSRPLLSIFESQGNDLAARAWGIGPVTLPTAAPGERGAAIRSKYEARVHVPGPRKAQVAQQPGMVDTAASNCDVARMFAVLVAGGKPGAEALHGACAKGEAGAQACCMLLVWGADPTAKRASDGATPEQVALQAGCSADGGDVVPILRAAAAKQAA